MWVIVLNSITLADGTDTTLLISKMLLPTETFGYFATPTNKLLRIPSSIHIHTRCVVVVFPWTYFTSYTLTIIQFFGTRFQSFTYAWKTVHLWCGWSNVVNISISGTCEGAICILLSTVSFTARHHKPCFDQLMWKKRAHKIKRIEIVNVAVLIRKRTLQSLRINNDSLERRKVYQKTLTTWYQYQNSM